MVGVLLFYFGNYFPVSGVLQMAGVFFGTQHVGRSNRKGIGQGVWLGLV